MMMECWKSGYLLCARYDTGNPGGYEIEEINQIRDFLAKCNSYYSGELIIPNRALVYHGDPYATDNYCAPYTSLAGKVPWASGGGIPEVLIRAYINKRIAGYTRTDQYGNYILDYLEENTYKLEVELRNGDIQSRENISLTIGGGNPDEDFIFNLSEEIISFNDTCKYKMIKFGQQLPAYWNTISFNADSWDEGNSAFNTILVPKEEGTIVNPQKYGLNLLIRKTFNLNDTDNLFFNLSSNIVADVYLNNNVQIKESTLIQTI